MYTALFMKEDERNKYMWSYIKSNVKPSHPLFGLLTCATNSVNFYDYNMFL